MTDEPESGPAPDPDAGANGARDVLDPMAVVLRLPSGRGRAGGPVHPETPDGAEATVATQPSGIVPADDEAVATGSGHRFRHAHSAEATERADWAWVEEWRAGNEPTPWATGLALSAFSALVVGVAVWVLAAGLSDRPVVAVLVNLLVAGGLAPAIWLSRGLPVLRWIGAGAAAGIVIGWISALLMLPLPAP